MLSYLHSERKVAPEIVSIEIEKANQGFENLIPYGDVVFISKDVSEANGAKSLKEALEIFKRHQRKAKSRLICTWGHKGRDLYIGNQNSNWRNFAKAKYLHLF